MRVLVVDNYDSFTYNLVQMIGNIASCSPIVITNSTSVDEVEALLLNVDCVVLSPGPGTPSNPDDFGVCRHLLLHCTLPILGVCLGLQGMATVFGGSVIMAHEPVHGCLSPIRHTGHPIYDGIPQEAKVVRYNSLLVDEGTLPHCLEIIAETTNSVGDREIMGLVHKERPIYGIQYHPESICTTYGEKLLSNFLGLVYVPRLQSLLQRDGHCRTEDRPNLAVEYCSTDFSSPAFEGLALALANESGSTVWLDSALHPNNDAGRFSYTKAGCGSLYHEIHYNRGQKQVSVVDASNHVIECFDLKDSFFGYLKSRLQEHRGNASVPFDFVGGYIGFIGYEMKHECEVYDCEASGSVREESQIPDVMLVFVDRFVVFDHLKNHLYCVCVDACSSTAKAESLELLQHVQHLNHTMNAKSKTNLCGEWKLRDTFDSYTEKVEQCRDLLRRGESYELCLTTKRTLSLEKPIDGVLYREIYNTLRRGNAAPFGALLQFQHVHVLSSSPERFLKVNRDRVVECKPIKGTVKRSEDPIEDEKRRRYLQQSEKDRAENLMIVDLVRNDFGRVCSFGSVHVPVLMEVETFASVHHLVSTVRGTLQPDENAVSCFQSSFPAGSMTGAPKKRSMDLLEEIEQHPRGIYSGAIGFFSINGAADFSVVIRTLVGVDENVSIGCGGAIVYMSDKVDEYEEMMAKGNAVLSHFAPA